MDSLIDRLKIGVIGLGQGAGAAFVSSCIARALADTGNYHPAVLEPGHGSLYDSLGMDRLFAGKDYFNFYETIALDKSIRGRSNHLFGVNWMLRTPGENRISIDLFRMMRMANHALGDIVILRISKLTGETFWQLLKDMDRLLLVIDPLPSKMLENHELLCSLRASGLPVIYLVNKMNGGVKRRELLDYLKLKKLLYLPLIDQTAIYGAEYSCRLAYDLPPVKARLKKPIEELIEELFTFPSFNLR